MPIDKFETLKLKFQTDFDPITKKPFTLVFDKNNFQRSELPLFQLAANEKLKSLKGVENIKCSVKYQVLSKETAMIGICKQYIKATGKLREFDISMDRVQSKI